MAKSYSQDLRDLVIDGVEKEGMSRRVAARRFGVSDSAAIKWLQCYQRTGNRTPVGTGGHRPSVLKPHRAFLEAVLAEKPDITPRRARAAYQIQDGLGQRVKPRFACAGL